MPPETHNASDPAEWLRRARRNLARARAGRTSPEVLYEDLCFDAQQAAEKTVKAVLVHRLIAFPKTPDTIDLFTLLEKRGLNVPQEIREADALTQFAVRLLLAG